MEPAPLRPARRRREPPVIAQATAARSDGHRPTGRARRRRCTARMAPPSRQDAAPLRADSGAPPCQRTWQPSAVSAPGLADIAGRARDLRRRSPNARGLSTAPGTPAASPCASESCRRTRFIKMIQHLIRIGERGWPVPPDRGCPPGADLHRVACDTPSHSARIAGRSYSDCALVSAQLEPHMTERGQAPLLALRRHSTAGTRDQDSILPRRDRGAATAGALASSPSMLSTCSSVRTGHPRNQRMAHPRPGRQVTRPGPGTAAPSARAPRDHPHPGSPSQAAGSLTRRYHPRRQRPRMPHPRPGASASPVAPVCTSWRPVRRGTAYRTRVSPSAAAPQTSGTPRASPLASAKHSCQLAQ